MGKHKAYKYLLCYLSSPAEQSKCTFWKLQHDYEKHNMFTLNATSCEHSMLVIISHTFMNNCPILCFEGVFMLCEYSECSCNCLRNIGYPQSVVCSGIVS